MSVQKEIKEGLEKFKEIISKREALSKLDSQSMILLMFDLKHITDKFPTQLSHLLELIEQKDAEIAKLREIQRALVLTPMQKMSRAMEIIDKQKGADICAP